MAGAKAAMRAGAKAAAKVAIKGGVRAAFQAGVRAAGRSFLRTAQEKLTRQFMTKFVRKYAVKKIKKGPKDAVEMLWEKCREEEEMPQELDHLVLQLHLATGMDINEIFKMAPSDFLGLFGSVAMLPDNHSCVE